MNCKKCGREISENDTYCPGCGAKQVMTYREVFDRRGLSEKDFIGNINKWFQWHPKAANIKCTYHLKDSYGLFVNKYKLQQFVIEYELFENDNENQYGLVKMEKYALVKKSLEKCVAEWQSTHPQVQVVNWQGGTNSRGSSGSLLLGGLGASNRMTAFIFFKFPRKQG